MSDEQVASARLEAVAARERLLGSVHELQSRLAPRTIAEEAWDNVRERGSAIAASAAETVVERPVAAGAAAIGVAAFFARKPLTRLVCRLFRGKRDSDGEE
jgi:hypothetical protein